MKKTGAIFCILLFLFAFSGVSTAATWLPGVNASTGWLDADKDWTDDTLLCWAAAASNMLAYTGWTGGLGLTTADQIFDEFEPYWNDDVGNPYYGVDWWFSGRNQKQGDAGWAQLTDSSHTGFYSIAEFNTNFSWANYNNLSDIENYISNNRATSIMLDGPSFNHFVTVWAVDTVTNQIWVTDSDDSGDSLDIYNVDASGSITNGSYSGFTIDSYYGLSAVPVPGAVWLLGTGLLGLAGFRRKQ